MTPRCPYHPNAKMVSSEQRIPFIADKGTRMMYRCPHCPRVDRGEEKVETAREHYRTIGKMSNI